MTETTVPGAPKNSDKIRQRMKGCGAGCLSLLIVAFLIALCSTEEKTIEHLKDANDQIRSVELSGPNAWVVIDLKDASSIKDYPFAAGMVLKDVGRAVKANVPEIKTDTQFVQYVVTAPSTGRLGEEGHTRIFMGRLHVADLRKANYDKMSESQMLNISDEVTVPSRGGGEVVHAFCMDADYQSWAREFCGRV